MACPPTANGEEIDDKNEAPAEKILTSASFLSSISSPLAVGGHAMGNFNAAH